MKYQALFCKKNNNNKQTNKQMYIYFKVPSAAIVISLLRINMQNNFHFLDNNVSQIIRYQRKKF